MRFILVPIALAAGVLVTAGAALERVRIANAKPHPIVLDEREATSVIPKSVKTIAVQERYATPEFLQTWAALTFKRRIPESENPLGVKPNITLAAVCKTRKCRNRGAGSAP